MDKGTPQLFTNRQKIIRWSMLGLTAAVLIIELCFHTSALIAPINPILRLVGIAAGCASGFYFSYWISAQPRVTIKDWRFYLAFTAMPFLGAAIGSYGARTLFEMGMFYAFDTKPAQMSAMVKSKSSRRGFIAMVKAYDDAREIGVVIDGNLYANLEPYRHPGRDCLSLPVQIGRDGVKRFKLPATWFDEPIGVGHLTSCSTSNFRENNATKDSVDAGRN